jgi:hypothetical protein
MITDSQPQSQLDRTVRIFDQFYNIDLVVDANAYEVVYSYFEFVSKSKTIAKNFSTVLFIIAQQTNIPVMTLLENVKGSNNKLDVDATMAYYINSIKSKTTLYGVSVVPAPNQRAQRNILV